MPNICTVVVVVVPYILLFCFYAPFIALHKMHPYFNLNNLSQGDFETYVTSLERCKYSKYIHF